MFLKSTTVEESRGCHEGNNLFPGGIPACLILTAIAATSQIPTKSTDAFKLRFYLAVRLVTGGHKDVSFAE